jgi:isoleucyl-tRNA synthetase
MFDVKQDKSFSKREEKIQEFWKENNTFIKSLENRKNAEFYSIYDGPPFATGLPHYGHLLAGTIKDVVPRYMTMKGYYVPRRFGWDCHGLPVENEIEKAKELSGSVEIEKFGIAKFNEECEKIVLRYTSEWKKTVERMGRWVDFSNTYKTMDKTFMESVWWVFKELYEKGLIYEGFKVMPFSFQMGTPLSNFEANSNYKEVDDPSLVVSFQTKEDKDTYFLAWTTTPWTLVSNLALSVGGDIDYVTIKDKKLNKKFIFAKARIGFLYKDENDYEILSTCKGSELKNKKYNPLFSYFSDRESEGAFRVLVDDFVSLDDGTGIVHTAPAFGEMDFYVCKRENIDIVCPVDNNGKFTSQVPEYQNMLVKDADKLIIKELKSQNKIFHHGQIRHRYPFCWRSDTPLIYKAITTWFVSVEKIKENLIKSNEQIHWVPNHLKNGRFGKWLDNARDWAISRNRYWGTPIPIWRNEKGDIKIIGSIEELEEKTGKKIDDIHRQYIDDLTFEIDGEKYTRIKEVFDCWFESGSMPYAQNHYPFENEKQTLDGMPADFIAEGLDQTRGWFYTLNVISTALFNKPAFKNVIVNGIILAEDGNKMSKRLKNYPDPTIVINKYGADAIRLYMLHSPAVKAEDLRFSEKGVEHVLRQLLIPLWNSYVFLSTYASIYNWKPSSSNFDLPDADIDRWIISNVNKIIIDVDAGMKSYDLSSSVDPLVGFIDKLTNWYIRRSRTRFWSDKESKDRTQAFETLYSVLLTFSKIIAPFIPYISEEIYQELRLDEMLESVHLCDYPSYSPSNRDEGLEKEMDYVKRAVSIGHSLRKEFKIKVRQPLLKAHLIAGDEKILSYFKKQENLIKEELNVKEIQLHMDESKFIHISAKPNFPILGKKIGKLMPRAKAQIEKFTLDQINQLNDGKGIFIDINDEKIEITKDDVLISRQTKEEIAAKNENDITIALETKLTPLLIEEALSREIVNKINTMRREKGLEVADRINVIFDCDETVKSCFSKYRDYICTDTLIVDCKFEKNQGQVWDLNDHATTILIEKA